jgi:hypothetical protein
MLHNTLCCQRVRGGLPSAGVYLEL